MYRVLNSESCVVYKGKPKQGTSVEFKNSVLLRNVDGAECRSKSFNIIEFVSTHRSKNLSVVRIFWSRVIRLNFPIITIAQIVVDTAEGFVKCCDSL